jgi:hypothetical protein
LYHGEKFFQKGIASQYVIFFNIDYKCVCSSGHRTVTPNASSVLDITSTTQGMSPMTTAQRTAIASPADGLMVYDTDLKLLLLQLDPQPGQMNSAATGRLKFKLIKSTDVLATVLAAGGGTQSRIGTNTTKKWNCYFDKPIDFTMPVGGIGQDMGMIN